MPETRYTRTEPHELVLHVYLTDPDEPTSRESSFAVFTRAWVWARGAGARRIPDNRMVLRGVVAGQTVPHDRAAIAAVLREVASRLDRPA